MQRYAHPLFDDPALAWGPPVTPELVADVERALGLRLPPALVADLATCNGGYLRRTRMQGGPRTVRVRELAGVGYPDGLELSEALCREWDYPTPCLVLSGEGPTAVMLDYRRVGPHGDPAVIFVDTDHEVDGRPVEWTLAPTWAAFRDQLHYSRSRLQVAVQGLTFHEDILDAAAALGAVGATRSDYEGGHTRSLDNWQSDDDGPALLRVLQPQRPNGSRRMAELGEASFVVESNVRDRERFIERFSQVMPGRHVRLC